MTTTLTRVGSTLAAAAALGLTACEPSRGCTPTSLDVHDASAIDLRDPTASGILKARLTTEDGPVEDRPVRFWIEHREFVSAGERLLDPVGNDRTGRSGVATVSLRDRGYRDSVADRYADRYGAAFRGDETYCPSYGAARFQAVRGVPSDAPRNPLPTPIEDYFSPAPSP